MPRARASPDEHAPVVCVRVRPRLPFDDQLGEACVEADPLLGNEVTVHTAMAGLIKPFKFSFDTVFGPQISQCMPPPPDDPRCRA